MRKPVAAFGFYALSIVLFPVTLTTWWTASSETSTSS
jgi:hypothetical protein